VFVGGCSLEAAEAVAGGGWRSTETESGIVPSDVWDPAPETLDKIAALVDASLVRPETGPNGTTRYGILGTIREYGLEQLEASGEGNTIHARHAVYYSAFAERYGLAE
jgi:predicted ATPase